MDASQAHKTIDKLVAKVNKINAVVNKSSGGSGLEKKIEKALLQQERLQQATLKTKLAEERLTTQKNKSTTRSLSQFFFKFFRNIIKAFSNTPTITI